jgi:hypothetical protein
MIMALPVSEGQGKELSMYNPVDEYAKAHQSALLEEARIERSLRSLRDPGHRAGDSPGLRDKVLLVAGDWMIALGRRMHNATRCCASHPLSEGRV